MTSNTRPTTSEAIHRRTGPTFHLATRLFPERVRYPTHVAYAFFRVADDVVDTPEARDPDAQRRELAALRDGALGREPADDPVVAAFRDLCDERDVPDAEVETFVAAMARDVEATRYETFADLEEYLRGSAVAVANVMLAVMDPEDPEAARPHAAALAEALQLTNFLRDVREDVTEYGRVYLPLETLAAHGVTEAQVERLDYSEGFAAAVESELRRAEERYWTGVAGVEYLPPDCRLPVLLAAVLYADYHRLVRARDHDVLTRPPTLTRTRRLSLLARTLWHWRRTRDAVATFRAVTDVPGGGHVSTDDGGRSPSRDRGVARRVAGALRLRT
ncbi:MAG: phytoene/squalene synthase family protein [Halobacteriaceae archaeon]